MFSKVFLVFVALSGLVTSQSTQKKDGKLYSGQTTQIGQAPFAVAIFYQGNFICAGAIVENDKILTAASCIPSLIPAGYQVRVGNSVAASGIPFAVTTIVRHPQYNAANKNYDIAKLTVSGSMTAPAAGGQIIPQALFIPNTWTQVTVYGWGATRLTSGGYSYILQSVNIPVVDKTLCSSKYGISGYSVGNTLFCAGSGTFLLGYTAEICSFDLGDPVVFNGQLIGIGSQLLSGCGWGLFRPPSVFTSIARVQPF